MGREKGREGVKREGRKGGRERHPLLSYHHQVSNILPAVSGLAA